MMSLEEFLRGFYKALQNFVNEVADLIELIIKKIQEVFG